MRIGIIGAGMVGLALARALARAGGEVTVLDKERAVATHQSGHNSGVVHAGLYYQPGSLKAELCGRGRGMLREFCAEHSIAFDEVGKLVVAADESELAPLAEIERRSVANAVPDLRRVDAAGLRLIEPAARGVAALHSPHTAVVDFPAVARALAGEVRTSGGRIELGGEVSGIRQVRGTVEVLVTRAEGAQVKRFDRLVICAGLQVDRLAAMAGDTADPRNVPFLGMYYRLVPERRELVRGLIYPVPDPRFPFLGVHLTRTAHGEVLVGPNAMLGLAREAYWALGFRAADVGATLTWPGFYRLAAKYWRAGAHELLGAAVKGRFVAAAARYVPELTARDVERAPLGVRAQAVTRAGTLVDDFVIRDLGPVIAVRNAPSPAATSSLAIAEHLLPRILR